MPRARIPRQRTRGSVDRLPSGAYRVRVYAGVDAVTGQRNDLIEIVQPGPRPRAEAEAARIRMLNEVDERRNPRTAATVDQLLDRYLEMLDVSASTHLMYERYLDKHVRPFVGSKKAGALGPDELDSLYAELRRCRVHCKPRSKVVDHRTPRHEVAETLEKHSGLAALAGTPDMREVLAGASEGEPDAVLGLEAYVHRLAAGIASMAAAVGGIEALAFTGVAVDPAGNDTADGEITTPGAAVRTPVLPAREDLEITRGVRGAVLTGDGKTSTGTGARVRGEEEMTETEHGREMQALSPDECYRLLATEEIGRLGVNAEHYPLIFPVNYALDGEAIVIRTDAGTKLSAADHANVTFEVDQIDKRTRSGWSVLVRGLAEAVTEDHRAELVERTHASGAEPWAPGDHGHWMRLIPQGISGRRIVPGQLPPAFEPGAYL